jgi:hypothetical protein
MTGNNDSTDQGAKQAQQDLKLDVSNNGHVHVSQGADGSTTQLM